MVNTSKGVNCTQVTRLQEWTIIHFDSVWVAPGHKDRADFVLVVFAQSKRIFTKRSLCIGCGLIGVIEFQETPHSSKGGLPCSTVLIEDPKDFRGV